MKLSKKNVILGVFLVLALMGTTWVFAQGGEIHACVNPAGQIRIVETASSCRPEETPLQWNIMGPQGAEGPQGPPGAAPSGTLMNVYRAQIFGHAFHDSFYSTHTSYVEVPGTLSAQGGPSRFPEPAPGTQRRYRIEVSFAVNHDQTIYLRVRDPRNDITRWEASFQGGHAPNSWWSWGTSTITPWWLPWPRQHRLEMKCSDTSGAYLGSVWLVAEDIIP